MNDASDNVSKLFFISSDNSFQDFAARYEKLLLRKFVFHSSFSKISLERTSYVSPVITRAALFCNLSNLLIWRLLSSSFQIVDSWCETILSMQVFYTDCFSTEEQHHRDKAVKKAAAPAIITQQIAAKHYRRSNPNFQAALPSWVTLPW